MCRFLNTLRILAWRLHTQASLPGPLRRAPCLGILVFMSLRAKGALTQVLLASLFTGCSTVPAGRIIGATYPDQEVQVFSMGQGHLPDGQRDQVYLHLRVAVRNPSSNRSLHIDPRRQWLLLPAGIKLPPSFTENGGQSGIITVSPKRTGTIDLFYLMPAAVDEAKLHWSISDGTRESVSDTIAFAVLRAPHAPTTEGIWVPTGEVGSRYYVSTLRPWAEPAKDWYWWRESDFPAWLGMQTRSQIDENIGTSHYADIWLYDGNEEWYWVNQGSPSVTFIDTSRGSVRPGSRQTEGGWRRSVRRAPPSRGGTDDPPADASRSAGGSRDSDRAVYRAEPSRVDRPDPPAASPSSSSSQTRETESSASSVGRSWRNNR